MFNLLCLLIFFPLFAVPLSGLYCVGCLAWCWCLLRLFLSVLAANWLGALLIGVLAELLTDPQWRLLWITGFLGSLTTFSGLSVEMVGLMQAQRWGMALMATCLHVFGSFGLTVLGIKLAQI